MKFNLIRAEILEDNKTYLDKYRGLIVNGDHNCAGDPNNILRLYSTDTRWTQYQNGTISREKAVEYAVKRLEKKAAQNLQKQLDKLEKIENAPAVDSISISIDWVRSNTWGHNPHAMVDDGYNRYYGKASGCGYDKASAAVAEALNQSVHILKALCVLKESALMEGKSDISDTSCTGRHNENVCGYGAGHYPIPEFEGGVGMSCFESILKKCGFECTYNGGKTWDCYNFRKVAQIEEAQAKAEKAA